MYAIRSYYEDELPELDIFGHGVNPMNDKAEALDPYRFHIAVENHVYDHHLTEKGWARITSYNVCYTKLLWVIGIAGVVHRDSVERDDVAHGAGPLRNNFV